MLKSQNPQIKVQNPTESRSAFKVEVDLEMESIWLLKLLSVDTGNSGSAQVVGERCRTSSLRFPIG